MSKEQLEKCKEFARDNLSELAFELIEWHETGILRDGKLRELANMCKHFSQEHIAFAERLTEQYALKYASKGGKR